MISVLPQPTIHPDGSERLGRILYGRDAKASELLGGSNARLLHDAADELRRLSLKMTQNTARLQIMWEWVQSLQDAAGVVPPEEFFSWFDDDGVPKTLVDK